ncbi:hypothetical protein KIPB_004787 [Kipferlia bialata]|uniref:Vacuolar sorting protein 39/Transforming growth factor beta receptor-associated domain-containing protein n=1 Tax=Kipferlia bialata TaxID=797122 RepID=A0A9K3GIG0_9EUKA|nr:hypothetical protein KIPB_004787 [Kipferlia bialata]|eukprot:g4787.t1
MDQAFIAVTGSDVGTAQQYLADHKSLIPSVEAYYQSIQSASGTEGGEEDTHSDHASGLLSPARRHAMLGILQCSQGNYSDAVLNHLILASDTPPLSVLALLLGDIPLSACAAPEPPKDSVANLASGSDGGQLTQTILRLSQPLYQGRDRHHTPHHSRRHGHTPAPLSHRVSDVYSEAASGTLLDTLCRLVQLPSVACVLGGERGRGRERDLDPDAGDSGDPYPLSDGDRAQGMDDTMLRGLPEPFCGMTLGAIRRYLSHPGDGMSMSTTAVAVLLEEDGESEGEYTQGDTAQDCLDRLAACSAYLSVLIDPYDSYRTRQTSSRVHHMVPMPHDRVSRDALQRVLRVYLAVLQGVLANRVSAPGEEGGETPAVYGQAGVAVDILKDVPLNEPEALCASQICHTLRLYGVAAAICEGDAVVDHKLARRLMYLLNDTRTHAQEILSLVTSIPTVRISSYTRADGKTHREMAYLHSIDDVLRLLPYAVAHLGPVTVTNALLADFASGDMGRGEGTTEIRGFVPLAMLVPALMDQGRERDRGHGRDRRGRDRDRRGRSGRGDQASQSCTQVFSLSPSAFAVYVHRLRSVKRLKTASEQYTLVPSVLASALHQTLVQTERQERDREGGDTSVPELDGPQTLLRQRWLGAEGAETMREMVSLAYMRYIGDDLEAPGVKLLQQSTDSVGYIADKVPDFEIPLFYLCGCMGQHVHALTRILRPLAKYTSDLEALEATAPEREGVPETKVAKAPETPAVVIAVSDMGARGGRGRRGGADRESQRLRGPVRRQRRGRGDDSDDESESDEESSQTTEEEVESEGERERSQREADSRDEGSLSDYEGVGDASPSDRPHTETGTEEETERMRDLSHQRHALEVKAVRAAAAVAEQVEEYCIAAVYLAARKVEQELKREYRYLLKIRSLSPSDCQAETDTRGALRSPDPSQTGASPSGQGRQSDLPRIPYPPDADSLFMAACGAGRKEPLATTLANLFPFSLATPADQSTSLSRSRSSKSVAHSRAPSYGGSQAGSLTTSASGSRAVERLREELDRTVRRRHVAVGQLGRSSAPHLLVRALDMLVRMTGDTGGERAAAPKHVAAAALRLVDTRHESGQLLARYASSDTLVRLPSCIPLADLRPFLVASFNTLADHTRSAQTQMRLYQRRNDVALKRLFELRGHVAVRSNTTVCCVCLRGLGHTDVHVYPDGLFSHKGCIRQAK